MTGGGQQHEVEVTQIAPAHARYIKLGSAGAWAEHSLANGIVPFGYARIPHEPCLAGDWDDVERRLLNGGRTPGKAKDGVREIRDFYELGSDCLWITFADRHLWWAFAEPVVVSTPGDEFGTRHRRVIGRWQKTTVGGVPLRSDLLSTRLTQVANYRQTICRIRDTDYLLRRINDIPEPIVQRAEHTKREMLAVAAEMIQILSWAEFETMVDLIFTRSGWQRVSKVGTGLADVDIILEHQTIGERAFVQVKSTAGQDVLDDYLQRYKRHGGYQRFYFACHSPRGKLAAPDENNIHVWTGETLAVNAVQAGLFDWLTARSA